MKIIIVGIGKVGFTLAKYLSAEDHDVCIVDKSQDAIDKAADVLDIMCLRGNGLSSNTLLEAGIKGADVVIATTHSDEVNMLCCLTAKRLGAVNSVARIRDPEYAREVNELKKELGLGLVINPEREAAREIARILKFPAATAVENFASGRVELVSFRLRGTERMVGKPLHVVMGEIGLPVLFCTAVRGEEVIIPDGNYVSRKDDILYVAGTPANIIEFFKLEGNFLKVGKDVTCIGGGRVAYYLAKEMRQAGMQVKIIEIDRKRCEELDELLPDCTIICGDGTDAQILEEENVSYSHSLVTLTGRDEENLVTALYATKMKVAKVVAKFNRGNYEGLLNDLGIDSIVSPKNVTSARIIRYVRALSNTIGSNVERLYKIAGGRAEALEFRVKANARHLGEAFKDIAFRKNFLVAAIVRENKIIIPTGSDFLQEEDTVIVITRLSNVDDLNDIFEA